MRKRKATVLTALVMSATLILSGSGVVLASNPATDITAKKNKEWYDILDFDDTQEAEFAKKGSDRRTGGT